MFGFFKKKLDILGSVSKYLPSDPVIVEAGAHNGTDSVRMAKFWPDSKVHAFEPIPNLYDELQENSESFPNIYPHKLALGGVTGQTEIYISSGTSDASSSLLKPKQHLTQHPTVRFEESLMVDVITIDEWAKRNSINKIDFFWLDLQGYEMAALQHATSVLDKATAIYTEVNLTELYEGCPLYEEFKAWLETQGFTVLAEGIYWEDAGNVLFIREQL